MVTRLNLLLIKRKKKANESIRAISLLKGIFEKGFEVFHIFPDSANEF